MRGLLHEWYRLSRKTSFQITAIALLLLLCQIAQNFATVDGVANVVLKVFGYRSAGLILINSATPVTIASSILYWLFIIGILYFAAMVIWNIVDAVRRNSSASVVGAAPKNTRGVHGTRANDRWLSNVVKAEMDMHPHRGRLRSWFQVNTPSWATVILAGCFFAVSIGLFSLLPSLLWNGKLLIDATDLKDLYLAMWQVQGAIAAVGLPLLIVVIEFSKDVPYVMGKRSEALIRRSWIFPIIIFALLGTAKIGVDVAWFPTESVFWPDLLMFFGGTICLAIVAYTKMLRAILSPRQIKQTAMSLIKELMDIQLNDTIRGRLSSAALSKQLLDGKYEMDTLFIRSRRSRDSLLLKSHTYGYLCDVNVGKLADFQKAILDAGTIIKAKITSATEELGNVGQPQPTPRIAWVKRFEDEIAPEDNVIVRVDNARLTADAVAGLETQLAKLIRIFPTKRDSSDYREVIAHLRDSMIDLIRDYHSEGARESLDIFELLINNFLSTLAEWEATYSRETAMRERNSIGGGWTEIRWISDALLSVYEMAIRTEYVPSLRPLVSVPGRLSSLSIENGDYYVFNEFIGWYAYFYQKAILMENVKAKTSVVSLCSQHLSSLLKYNVLSHLENVTNVDLLTRYVDFAMGLISVFNSLLKTALDADRFEEFRGLSATLDDAFDLYLRRTPSYNLPISGAASESAPPELTDEQDLEKRHVAAADSLRKMRDVMLYGLQSRLLQRFLVNKLSEAVYQKWQIAFDQPHDIQSCWNIYREATSWDKSDLNWSLWEFEDEDRGPAYSGVSAHWSGIEIHFRSLLCVHWLKVLSTFTDSQKRETVLPPSSELTFLAGAKDAPLRKLLREMDAAPEKWGPVIGTKGLQSIPDLECLLENAVKAQQEARNQSIRTAKLSPTKLDIFTREIVAEWEANAEAREIVRIANAYEPVIGPAVGVQMWGFNELQPKDIYVDDSDVAIAGWGAQFGRDLAMSENQRFLEDLISNIDDLSVDIRHMPIPDAITRIADNLGRLKNSLSVLILDSWTARTAVENSRQFKAGTNLRAKSFIGHFNDMPVFNLHYQGDPYVIVVDVNKYCVWRQFKPPKQEQGVYLTDEIAFSLQSFSAQTARDAVKKNKKLLQDNNGNLVSEEAAILDLQLHVQFQLGEQFDICRKTDYKTAGQKMRVQW